MRRMDEASSCGVRPTFLQVMTHLPGSHWPYSDSAAPEAVAGEKDACGVGFLANLQGETSHWVLQQALRGLGCMEHRGGCGGDGDSGDGAGVLCQIPWALSLIHI